MQKQLSSLLGLGLILVGLLGLAGGLVLPAFGFHVALWLAGRLWPLAVIGIGLAFMLAPLLTRRRALGALFIPGILILTNGAILLFTSVTGLWWAWSYLWPLEVLALAMGFLLAAVFMRTVWLTLPAIIIGLNGLVLGFCTLTGLWEAWALLWTVEPLAVGLSLLLVALNRRSPALLAVGMLFCGFAGAAFTGLGFILLSDWWPLRYIGPAVIIAAGVLLMLWGLSRPQADIHPGTRTT